MNPNKHLGRQIIIGFIGLVCIAIPFSKNRSVNDKKWALDHFYEKLLTLEQKMNT